MNLLVHAHQRTVSGCARGLALGRQARLVGRFFDVSSSKADRLRGASQGTGCGGRAHRKGCEFHRRHGLYFFAESNWLGNRLDGEFSLSEAPDMDQREFPLLARVNAPSAAPNQWIRYAKTYRQAVRLAWKFRADECMTRQQLATEAKLYPQHVTDYLHEDDKPARRDLPADKVAAFEAVVGNSIVSQWLAAQSRLTVLEQVQASAFAEAA
jgi:hypothetical protein